MKNDQYPDAGDKGLEARHTTQDGRDASPRSKTDMTLVEPFSKVVAIELQLHERGNAMQQMVT